MAIEIIWSPEADETFKRNIDYLGEEWGDKEIEKYISETQKIIARLQIFPESYPQSSKSKKYRKARLNKYIALFYTYNKRKKSIMIVTFWNLKQNPDKLKY